MLALWRSATLPLKDSRPKSRAVKYSQLLFSIWILGTYPLKSQEK